MKKIVTSVVGLAVILPMGASAAVNSINGLTAAAQSLVSPGPNAANTMHMDIIQVGTDTHRFRWDGTPWRTDQGGSGTTTFSNGGVLFFNGTSFAQNTGTGGLFWDNQKGTLSIGTSTPPSAIAGSSRRLAIVGTSTNGFGTGISIHGYDDSSRFGSFLSLVGIGGTPEAPTAVIDDMALGAVTFSGFNGVDFGPNPNASFTTPKAQIRAQAEEDWTTTANGTGIAFQTTPNGSIQRSEKMRIAGNGAVGIGTNNPLAGLDIRTGFASPQFEKLMLQMEGETSTNQGLGMMIRNFTNTDFGSFIRLDAAKGTAAAPEAVTQNMNIGAVSFGGYDGSQFTVSGRAQLRGMAEEDWSSSAQGTGIAITTTASGGTTRTEKMRITGEGNVGIGTSNPAASLEVDRPGGISSFRLEGDTSCIIMKDSDGDGYTYITANDGVLTASTEPCDE